MCFVFEKHFPWFCDGEPQNSCRGSSFFGRISENGEPDFGFALLGGFLKKDDCNGNHFSFSVFKKPRYLEGVFACTTI